MLPHTCGPAPPEILTWLFINVSSVLCSTSPLRPISHFRAWSMKYGCACSTCPGALAQVWDLTGSDLVHVFFQSSNSQAPQQLLPRWAQHYFGSAFFRACLCALRSWQAEGAMYDPYRDSYLPKALSSRLSQTGQEPVLRVIVLLIS